MLRETPPRNAVRAAAFLALALLAASMPARADGFPTIQPATPGLDCAFGMDAGNSYEGALYLYDDTYCIAHLTPVVDEQDWYAFWLPRGGHAYIYASGIFNDVDLCAFGPSDNTTPLACSTFPMFTGDSVEVEAEESGYYRFQIRLAVGAGLYTFSLFSYGPPPPVFVDVAVLELRVEKPELQTDLADTGVVNPLGAWKLTATVANLGEWYACPEVAFSIQGEALFRPFEVAGLYVPGFQPADYVEPDYVPCIAPGDSVEVSVDWRPLSVVGDVVITARASEDWDFVWENNEKSVATFVLVGGL